MTLVLGGPFDGQHLMLPVDQRALVVPIPENPFLSNEALSMVPTAPMKTFEYERAKIAFGRLKETVSIFVPTKSTELLIDYMVWEYLKNGPSA